MALAVATDLVLRLDICTAGEWTTQRVRIVAFDEEGHALYFDEEQLRARYVSRLISTYTDAGKTVVTRIGG